MRSTLRRRLTACRSAAMAERQSDMPLRLFTFRNYNKSRTRAKDKGSNNNNNQKRPSKRHANKHKRNGISPSMHRAAQRMNPAQTPETAMPPISLRATASPFAFVSARAAADHDMDPQSLFAEQQQHHQHHNSSTGRDPPPSFANVNYAYVSPKMFRHELPSWEIPEVCLLGRSNVGKSSLLNALTNNSDLARCSKQPGRTQQVNYFGIFPNHPDDSYYTNTNSTNTRTTEHKEQDPSRATGFLVDLPGYGFAKAPGELVHGWQKTTQQYLLQRRDSGHMQRVFLLVDARRGPLQLDRILMGWFDEAEMDYSVVLTKSDRVGRPQQVKCANEVCMRYESQLAEEYGHQGPVVHLTSARDGLGIHELMVSIDAEFLGYREREDDRGGRDEGFGELRVR